MATLDVLQPRLRQLKLSGMLDAISARSEEARTTALDPLDFLLLLLDDELARRHTESIARRIHQARRVLFAKTNALLTDLAGGRADGSWQQRFRRYVAPDLLVLDDFAMREYTVVQAEDLYELVSRRYQRSSLILTTNREPKDLYPLFPNPVIAEGLLDRLVNSAFVITMTGRSYRPRQRPNEPTFTLPKAKGVANNRDQPTGKLT